jgi:hypothetical protein
VREQRNTSDVKMLEAIQHEAFKNFLHETNPANRFVIDKTSACWPASIAAVGLGLSPYPVGIERGFVARQEATRTALPTRPLGRHGG